jgi:AcrR family transcriptional regulator
LPKETNLSRKEKILAEATRLFALKGFAETSTAELARLTGVAEGTVFYHFSTKEELFLAVLENIRRGIVAVFEAHEAEAGDASGLDRIERGISFYLAMAAEMEDSFLLLHRRFPHVLARENPVCREHLRAIHDRLADLFEQAVAAGRRDGSIREVPTRATALLLLALVDGLARFGTSGIDDPGALQRECVTAARRMLGAEEAGPAPKSCTAAGT